MKLCLRRLSYSLLTGAALFGAFAPERWLYRQRIAPAAGPVARVALDRAVYDGASVSLADLRVVNAAGAETPYLLSVAEAARQSAELPVRIVNKETRGGALYATLELAGGEPHNQVQLAVTRDDFRSRVAIEASDDGRSWASVRRSAYIFRYRTGDGQLAEHTTLRYPDSRRRYLRLAIAAWPDPEQFTGATVHGDRSAEARRSIIHTAGNPAGALRDRTYCAPIDTGTRAPRDRVELAPAAGSPAVFHRSVTLEQSADGKAWSWLDAGAIYRIAGEESLAVAFPETRQPWLRICIFQGDDQPVRIARARILGVDREVTFRAETPGPYWLYYGALNAAAPEYDLARIAGKELTETAQPGSLAAREANPAYRAPPPPVQPWTERFPGLLYAALALAVGGLGWMALRLLRN